MRHQLPSWALLLLIFVGPGCVSDGRRIAARALETAHASRIAAIVKYDRDYVRQLEEWIRVLKKELGDPTIGDAVSLLFALDELGDIYTFRIPTFERARSVNQEIQVLLRKVRSEPPPLKVGWFFSRHRRTYPFFIGPFTSVLHTTERRAWSFLGPGSTAVIPYPPLGRPYANVRLQESGFRWVGGNGEEVLTLYPPVLLKALWAADIDALEARSAARDAMLTSLLTSEEPSFDSTATSLLDRDGAHTLELEGWTSALSSLSETDRTKFLLERVWRLRGEMPRDRWIAAVTETGQRYLTAEHRGGVTRANDPEGIRARLRLATALLGAQRAVDAIAVAETAFPRIGEYDKWLATQYKEAIERLDSTRWLDIVIGVIGLVAGNPIAVSATIVQETSRSEMLARVKEQLGEGQRGLAAWLTEPERLEFHTSLGQAYQAAGETSKAIDQYKQAIEIIERQRSTLRTEAWRIAYLENKEVPYRRLVPLLAKEGNMNAAFEYTERARSRAFLDLLSGAKLRFGTPEETNEYARIVRRQSETAMLAAEGQLPGDVASRVYASLRDVAVQPVEARTVSLEFEALTSVQTAGPNDVVEAMGKGAALLTFLVGDDETTVLRVDSRGLSGWTRPIGRSELQRRVAQFRKLTWTADSQVGEIEALGASIYRDLLAPALEGVDEHILYVAPDGPLHYLPFAAVYDGSRYILDRFTLLTVPSGTILTYLAKKPSIPGGATVALANPDVGDPRFDLPYAEREGAAVREHRPGTVLFVRAEAKASALRAWAGRANVLHLAAHAILNTARPLDSAVVLAPGDGHDGRFTAAEAFGLRLPGSLVVLSACETGLGQIAAGDELIGLTRAFMYAGAPHIVATLWGIADETAATLMMEFYARLGRSAVPEALREAQLATRKHHSHPFHWGAFVLYGHYRHLTP